MPCRRRRHRDKEKEKESSCEVNIIHSVIGGGRTDGTTIDDECFGCGPFFVNPFKGAFSH
jgi:hypothetical protein